MASGPLSLDLDEPLSPDEQRRQRDSLSRLLDVTRTLAAEIDLNTVLETIAHGVAHALDCERSSLFRYDRRRHELYTTVATELEISEIRQSADRGIVGHVVQTGALTHVEHPAGDSRWNPQIDRLTGFQTRNILAAPVVSPHDGELLGVLQLLNKRGGTFDRFDEQLVMAFSQHAAVALDRARRIDELRNRQQIETELNLAREIQCGFMPRQLPEIPHYEAATWWRPYQSVGGDYCDLLPLADGRVGLVIADVSGHGLGPSLLMASVRAALRTLVQEQVDPSVMLKRLDRALTPDLQQGRFITMLLAALDPQAHRLRFANAGHAPALHFQASADRFIDLQSTGVPLGVMDDAEFPTGPEVSFEVGDLLILCTDGLVEAMDDHGTQFTLERLQDELRTLARKPLSTLVEQIGNSVENYCAQAQPPDDLTLLVLRRNA